jgi:hypothetical protein
VANVSAGFNDCLHVGIGVDYAIVLEVATSFDHDPADITAQRSPWADITARANNNVADENCGWVNERGRIHHWDNTFKGIDVRHGKTEG